MTVRERILIMKLLEQQEKDPECLNRLGVRITIHRAETIDPEERKEKRDV